MEKINILNEQGSGISIIKILLIYYLLNLTSGSPLLSKQLKDYIENDRLVKHLIGFITVTVLISLFNTKTITNMQIICYAFLCYSWFILSTKLDIHWNIIILISIIIGYLYENMIRNKDIELDNDKVLTNEEKNIIKDQNNTQKEYINWGLVIATMIGVYLYSQKKTIQYGGGFNLFKFLLE